MSEIFTYFHCPECGGKDYYDDEFDFDLKKCIYCRDYLNDYDSLKSRKVLIDATEYYNLLTDKVRLDNLEDYWGDYCMTEEGINIREELMEDEEYLEYSDRAEMIAESEIMEKINFNVVKLD